MSRTTISESEDRSGPDQAADSGQPVLSLPSLTHRVLLLLATLSVAATSFESWSAVPYSWVVALLVPVAFGGGIVLVVAIISAHSEERLKQLDWVLLAFGVMVLLTLLAGQLFDHPNYTSDEGVLSQGAATLLLHGHNPYGANLEWAFTKYRLPANWGTYTLTGGEATTYSYPALPLYLAAIAQLLTKGWQTAPIESVAIIIVTLVVMFRLMPLKLRPVAVMALVPIPMLFGMANAGLNEILSMLLLMLVAWRWTSTGESGSLTRVQSLQAVALGLALATQQLAWFVAPFVVIGIYLARRHQFGHTPALTLVVRYVAYALATFFVTNLPFIVWGPKKWLIGVTLPLRQHSLPFGQGLIDWTTFLHFGGGMLDAYNYAGGTLLLGLLVLYSLNFRRLGHAAFALPILPLFLSSRPLDAYLVPMTAVIIVSLATLESHSLQDVEPLWQPKRPRTGRLVSLVCLFPALLFTVLAITVPSPLTLKVVAMRNSSGTSSSIWWIKLSVHNRSSDTLTPRFITSSTGSNSDFWHQITGPLSLAPGETRDYVVVAPNTAATFSSNAEVTLAAVTASPATFSSAGRISAHGMIADLEPQYINQSLSPGASVTFSVRLRTVPGVPVHRAGVTVVLKQSVQGGGLSTAIINGHRAGDLAVTAVTNGDGVATFTVTDETGERFPLLFQASIVGADGDVYGSSINVSVFWRQQQ